MSGNILWIKSGSRPSARWIRSICKWFTVITIMLMFASCGKVQQSQEQEENVFISHLKQQDIPVPVGFSPIESLSQKSKPSKTISLSYKGNLNIKQSVNFYKQSMELNGWEIQDFSTKQEGLLFCNKTTRRCAISIRKNNLTPSSHKTDIHLRLHNAKNDLSITSKNNSDTINTKELTLS